MSAVITNEEIEALKREARAAGDDRQAAICTVALGYEIAVPDRNGGIYTMETARAECERVIRTARTQS